MCDAYGAGRRPHQGAVLLELGFAGSKPLEPAIDTDALRVALPVLCTQAVYWAAPMVLLANVLRDSEADTSPLNSTYNALASAAAAAPLFTNWLLVMLT